MYTVYSALQDELNNGSAFVVATVISTQGSTPRKTGAKMLMRQDGSVVGTVGGGKFESLVIEAGLKCLESGKLETVTLPLHEKSEDSFGAICGGEVTVLLEPIAMRQRLLISGAGHCGRALAQLALNCGWPVIMFDDRPEQFDAPLFHDSRIHIETGSNALSTFELRPDDCVVLVSKGHSEDRAALKALLSRDPLPELAYLGMIGSDRKVSMVMKDLAEEGLRESVLKTVYAPIGLDIGSESPDEIAVSIMAEILKVTRNARGGHLKKQ
jgi:xanthine dehydrogenase accessory factor